MKRLARLLRLRRANDPSGAFLTPVVDILQERGVRAVVDVGANRGGFARALRTAGFRGVITSIEPGELAHRALLEEARGDPAWRVGPRMALAECDGPITLHGFNRDDMNSLLPPQDAVLARTFPSLARSSATTVEARRLDGILDTLVDPRWIRCF